jgi:hypothetical protein
MKLNSSRPPKYEGYPSKENIKIWEKEEKKWLNSKYNPRNWIKLWNETRKPNSI